MDNTDIAKLGDDKPLILIVDDIPENLQVLSETLLIYGYEVIQASNGETAIQLAASRRPDLILLDILMPGMNGYEVCTRLKSDPELNHIPIIFLSAKVEIEDIIQGFSVGGSDYVAKPFNIHEVVARVATHVKLKRVIESNNRIIEQLKAKNEELNLAEQKLIETNASKDKYFSILAHDLRNPFQGFMGLTDVLISELDSLSAGDIKEMAGALHISAMKVYNLLENLLSWSRIQLGRFEFSPERIDLHQIVNLNKQLYSENAGNKSITITNEISAGIFVRADRNMLDTILRNLFSNAIKFCNEGGNIHISASDRDFMVEILFSDDGIGMGQDMISDAFKLDKTIVRNGTSNELGTGLGLILMKELIEKNGGKIRLESETNKGTTFHILLQKN